MRLDRAVVRAAKRAVLSFGLILAGCVDQPNPIPGPGSSNPVDRLSEMGIFEGNLADLRPRADIVAYDVDVSLYSDGAQKHRFLWLPPGTQIHATADRWEVPVGAYFIKNFYYPKDARDPTRGILIVETRFIIRRAEGLTESTYVWNDEQTDAFVSGGNVNVPVRYVDASGALHEDYFHIPGTSLCDTCHGGRTLGIRTRQMVRPGMFADGTTDQVSHLVAAGVLSAAPPQGVVLVDPLGGAPLGDRARSYLDANCAHCHATTGIASGTRAHWDWEHTNPSGLPICRKAESIDDNDRIIVPGYPERSGFLSRMVAHDPFARMPQGPTHVPDGPGIAMLSEWVAQMSPAGCP
jgi:uncharacterized repeat protein (TIGR03806 family)